MMDVTAIKRTHLERFKETPRVFTSPGRVNLIGEHTDYAEGFVMPAAIDFSTQAAISCRDDRQVAIYSANFTEQVIHDLDAMPERGSHHWSDYPLGVVHMLRLAGIDVPGFSMSIEGNVPLGAGLSSSASIEVAVALAVLSAAGTTLPPPEVARLCQRAENSYVGASTGIMDQFIACCGAEDHALLLDCRSLSYRLAPIPSNISLVICNTMVKHSHAGGEYNTRRAEVEEGTAILRSHRPEVRVLRDATPEDLERWGHEMPPNVLKRCRHIITDSLRAIATADALEAHDLKKLGELLAAAHASYRDDFEASCPEADIMVDLAVRDPHCYGARLTGGGFGGCTVNLVETSAAEAFSEKIAADYRAATGIQPDIYRCRASAAAHEVL
ncbi:galactokinase [Acidipila rosea]|uniref:Galactokinase n=1 Tax=Acidipila rosea TaxID=768535 RepID=A0A4R1L411_9BACT|nr:galactokinase [Acidipila rosea]TCK72798.1 galactokinase [Acidipila rosea]